MIYSGVKLQEEVSKAEKAYKKAIDYTKTSVFSFRMKPDYDQCSRFAKEAIAIYRRCGEQYHQPLVDALLLAAQSDEQIELFNHAATELEEAGDVYIKMNNPSAAADAYIRSAGLYRLNTQVDKAAQLLIKAAKVLEGSSVDKSLDLMRQACAAIEEEQRAVNCENIFAPSINAHLTHGRIEQAIDLLKRQNILFGLKPSMFKEDIGKNMLCEAILLMSLKRYRDARTLIDEEMSQSSSVSSEHVAAAGALLDAIGRDTETMDAVWKEHPVLKYILNGALKVAKKLQPDASAREFGQANVTNIEDFYEEEGPVDLENNMEELL